MTTKPSLPHLKRKGPTKKLSQKKLEPILAPTLLQTPPVLRTRVLIVEDQTAVCEMTMEILKSVEAFEVVGTAANGTQAVAMALQLKPDLVILDVMIPEMSGVEVLRRIKTSLPKMRVLVFSAKQEPQVVRGLIQEGMHGFVNKHSPLSELRQAITLVANGGIWFDEKFSQTVRDALAKPATQGDGMIDLLTPREREISMLIARSHSSKDVAALLNISVKTSENHRANLMRKLGVRDVAGLVRLAIRHGLIDPAND